MDGLALIRDGIDRLAAVETAAVSDNELPEVLADLHRETARLMAQVARLTAAYDIRKVWAADGSRSAAARLARDCHTSRQAMRAQVQLARRLRLMPAVAAAFANGDVDEEHVRVLARLAGSPRPAISDAFGEAEEELLGFAKDLDFDSFVIATRYWEQMVDEDGVEDQADDDYLARHLHLSDLLRGNKRLDGQLDAIGGAIVANELERLERELFESDWAEARAIHGDETRLEHLRRTPAQRRADALTAMAIRSATAPAEGQTPRPLFSVLVGYETLSGRICELANGTVVTPGQIAPWLTQADVERIVFDGRSRVMDVGVRTRFFTGALRRAIQVRDKHCTYPGCAVPAERCHVDHIQPYSEGGLTIQGNGRIRCPAHNPKNGRGRSDDDPEP